MLVDRTTHTDIGITHQLAGVRVRKKAKVSSSKTTAKSNKTAIKKPPDNMEEYFKVSKMLEKSQADNQKLKVTLGISQADNNKLKVTQKQKDNKWQEKADNMKDKHETAKTLLQELNADQKNELEKVPMIIEAVETIFPQFARQG